MIMRASAQQPVQVAPENIFAFLRRAFGRKNFTRSAPHRYIRHEKQAPGPQRPHRPLNRIVLQHAAARVDTHVRTVAPAFDCPFPVTAALAVIEEEEQLRISPRQRVEVARVRDPRLRHLRARIRRLPRVA